MTGTTLDTILRRLAHERGAKIALRYNDEILTYAELDARACRVANGLAAAGVRPGDVLLSVDGRKVNDPQNMLEAIAALAPGRQAGFELRRGKEKLEIRVEVGRRPALSRGD